MEDDDRPYVIESPTRIRLMPVAREWAREHGMSESEMARHLLREDAQRQAGLTQREKEN